jgi:hypothetical protein
MADSNVHFLSALEKLQIRDGDYRDHPNFQALPDVRNDTAWANIAADHRFGGFELSALKNVRCPAQIPQAGKY